MCRMHAVINVNNCCFATCVLQHVAVSHEQSLPGSCSLKAPQAMSSYTFQFFCGPEATFSDISGAQTEGSSAKTCRCSNDFATSAAQTISFRQCDRLWQGPAPGARLALIVCLRRHPWPRRQGNGLQKHPTSELRQGHGMHAQPCILRRGHHIRDTPSGALWVPAARCGTTSSSCSWPSGPTVHPHKQRRPPNIAVGVREIAPAGQDIVGAKPTKLLRQKRIQWLRLRQH